MSSISRLGPYVLFCIGVTLAIVASDTAMTYLSIAGGRGMVKAIADRRLGEFNRQIVAAEHILAQLDSKGLAGCDAASADLFAAAITEIDVAKGFQLLGSNGQVTCSNAGARGVGGLKDPEKVAAGEPQIIDIVTVPPEERKLLRVIRQSRSTPGYYAALLSVDELFEPLAEMEDVSVDQRRLTVGGAEIVQADVGRAMPAAEPLAGATRSSEVEPELIAASATIAARSLTLTVAVPSAALVSRSLGIRLIVDIAIAAAAMGGLAIGLQQFRRADPMQATVGVALRRREFQLVYHPVISLATGQMEYVEVEIQWKRPGGGTYRMADFVPLVVASGTSRAVFRWILAQCNEELALAFRLRPRLSLIIELFDPELIGASLCEDLQRSVDNQGIGLSQLVLGVRNGGATSQPADAAQAIVHDLRALGVTLAARQSGAADLSIEQVVDPDFGMIEIDIGLTDALADEIEVSWNLMARYERRIDAVVDLARTYGLSVVAVGVRSLEQARRLRALGVDCAAGPVFGNALTAGKLLGLLARMGISQPGARDARSKVA